MSIRISETHGLKAHFKNWLLPAGKSPRRIRMGILAGLTMQLDLTHQTQRWLGLQERELYGWIRRLSVGINTAVDVGANDGMYTLYFLAATSAGRVLSFEPSAECLADLNENLTLNHFAGDRLKIVSKKVGSTIEDGWTTLDSCLTFIAPPCLVKVDIDGGEGGCFGVRKLFWPNRIFAGSSRYIPKCWSRSACTFCERRATRRLSCLTPGGVTSYRN